MAENQRPVAGEIIDVLKSRLGKSVCEQIGNAQFADFAIMIDEAISTEIASAADLIACCQKTERECPGTRAWLMKDGFEFADRGRQRHSENKYF